MKLHFIGQYDALVKILLFGNAEFKPGLFITPTGTASIGFNFDLQNETCSEKVFEAIGFDPLGKILDGEAFTAERYYVGLLRSSFYHSNTADIGSLNTVVENILSARIEDNRYDSFPKFNRVKKLRFPDRAKAEMICYYLSKHLEKTVDDWLTSFGFDILRNNSQLLARNTRERAVLVSLAAQNLIGFDEFGSPLSIPLANALIDDNRAETWYQIRYGLSLKKSPDTETVKKQYLESDVFDLYDDGIDKENIGREQCKQLYSMYNLYKEQILYFERNYNYLIAEANEQYKFTNHQIKTLEQSFSVAYNHVRNLPPQSPLVDNYINVMEEDLDNVVTSWSEDDDLDHEIAIAS